MPSTSGTGRDSPSAAWHPRLVAAKASTRSDRTRGRAGTPFQPRTLVDVSLARSPVLWAAAGHPHYVFRTDYAQLLRITGGEAAEVG